MKRGPRKSTGGSAVDVSYADILADVQRLQALLENVGKKAVPQPKQRKKMIAEAVEEEVTPIPKANKYRVSNLEEVIEQEKQNPEPKIRKPRAKKIQESPVAEPQNLESQAVEEHHEETSAVATQEEQATVDEPTNLGTTESDTIENQEPEAEAQGKIHSLEQEIGVDTEAALQDRVAARLAKHHIDPKEEIQKTKLETDRSGDAWSKWSDPVPEVSEDDEQNPQM